MAIKGVIPSNEVVVDKEEPGSVDNRLSLIPSDFPVIEDWEDGETYDLSELGDDVTIRQISPGEFEVIPGATARQQATEEGAEVTKPPGRRPYRNPSVESMAEEM